MRFGTFVVSILLGTSLAMAAVPVGAASPAGKAQNKSNSADWQIYGGTTEINHFSTLTQINRKNVKRPRVAWTYDTQESARLWLRECCTG